MVQESSDPLTIVMSDEIDVDVLIAHLHDFPDLNRFRPVLTQEERARGDGYRIEEPRNVFTLARGLLRLELAKRLDVAPGEVAFDLRASGKPDVRRVSSNRPDWRFNVSHTGPHVVIALARGVDVGIDVERLDRVAQPLHIAKRFFTATEFAILESTPSPTLHRTFFAGWTRKEAIVKARGITMAESLATLSVELDPEATHPSYEDAPAVETRAVCRLTTFELAQQNLMGAVAVLGELRPRLKLRMVSAATFD